MRVGDRGAGRDAGVSPVIGVILLVAITVVLAASVFLGTRGIRADDSEASPPIVFRIYPMDFDNDNKNDRIKVVYTQGPSTLDGGLVRIEAALEDGSPEPAPVPAHAGDWHPGEYVLYRPTCASFPCQTHVTASVGPRTVSTALVPLDE